MLARCTKKDPSRYDLSLSTHLFTDAEGRNAVGNLIKNYRNRLEQVVWKNEEFMALAQEDDEEGVGTHSHRKFPSNYARGCGCSPDEIEIRGRWKGGTQWQGSQQIHQRGTIANGWSCCFYSCCWWSGDAQAADRLRIEPSVPSDQCCPWNQGPFF